VSSLPSVRRRNRLKRYPRGVYLTRVREACRRLASGLREWIANDRNLRIAWDYCRQEGGTSPGTNGRRYDDLDGQAVWSLVHALQAAILAGTYRPGADRLVRIAKGPGRGTRTLRLQDIEDRVVARAAVQVLQLVLDPTFAASSFGSRPGSDPWLRAMAYAETIATREDRWIWTADDLRDAFEQVPHGPLLEILHKRLPDERLGRFLEVMIANARHRGLRQGSPLSPLLLNVYLDHLLDTPWRRRHPETPLVRYVDDLLVLGRSRREAKAAYDDLRELLHAAGFVLKGSKSVSIVNLKRQPVGWLGFRFQRPADRLEIRLGDEAWEDLTQRLARLHNMPDAPLRADELLCSWIFQRGPTYRFEDCRATIERVMRLARSLALDEIPSRRTLRAVWKHGSERFRRWLSASRLPGRQGTRG
jgi:retron-type reverse transcriptase